MKISYFYQTNDDVLHEYQAQVSEPFVISILSGIGKGTIRANTHSLPEDVKVFYFPSGRVWYKNGNRFVGENKTKYRWAMANCRRQKAIEESKQKGK